MFGPPGAGKGTHAKRLARDLGIPHVSTGEILRDALAHGTPADRGVDEAMRRGELVPDEVVLSVVEDRLARPDARAGYLLDGFPRTLPQARALASALERDSARIDGVLSLDTPEEVLVQRLAGRLVCSRCQSTFNRFFRPPAREGICDACGGALGTRPDDEETAVRRRLVEYRARTEPVMQFFRDEGWPVHSISNAGTVEDVYHHVRAAARG